MIYLIYFYAFLWTALPDMQPELTININKPNNSLTGVWELMETTGQELPGKQIRLYTDDYFTLAHFGEAPAHFYASRGGFYTINNGQYTETYEFNTEDPGMVKDSIIYTLEKEGNKITLINKEGEKEVWQQIDDDKTVMTGVWQITGRKRPGEDTMTPIPDRDRKTIKILSGNRFQWAAINTGTGEFFGTGGGTFESDIDSYTEHIEFFSRDNSKAGIDLTFQKELKNGGKEWHHIGHGTTGKPVDEVWEKISK